jgi:hypothetical protein
MSRLTETQIDDLAGWEKWPLAALFLANALNIFLLYVPVDEMPSVVQSLIPWVRVACGVAAAASLEGTLIAVTMGRRHGRDSYWSWATMALASIFTASVAYYIHSSIGVTAAVLFMAQAAVLFVYTQHLAQPRKALQLLDQRVNNGAARLQSQETAIIVSATKSHDNVSTTARLRKCSKCGTARFWSLTEIRSHQQTDECQPPI